MSTNGPPTIFNVHVCIRIDYSCFVGTSFAFLSEELEVVMVGCENGSVVKCTIDALPAVSAAQSKPCQIREISP